MDRDGVGVPTESAHHRRTTSPQVAKPRSRSRHGSILREPAHPIITAPKSALAATASAREAPRRARRDGAACADQAGFDGTQPTLGRSPPISPRSTTRQPRPEPGRARRRDQPRGPRPDHDQVVLGRGLDWPESSGAHWPRAPGCGHPMARRRRDRSCHCDARAAPARAAPVRVTTTRDRDRRERGPPRGRPTRRGLRLARPPARARSPATDPDRRTRACPASCRSHDATA